MRLFLAIVPPSSLIQPILALLRRNVATGRFQLFSSHNSNVGCLVFSLHFVIGLVAVVAKQTLRHQIPRRSESIVAEWLRVAADQRLFLQVGKFKLSLLAMPHSKRDYSQSGVVVICTMKHLSPPDTTSSSPSSIRKGGQERRLSHRVLKRRIRKPTLLPAATHLGTPGTPGEEGAKTLGAQSPCYRTCLKLRLDFGHSNDSGPRRAHTALRGPQDRTTGPANPISKVQSCLA